MSGQFQLTPTGGQTDNRAAEIVLSLAGISVILGIVEGLWLSADYALGAVAALMAEDLIDVLPPLVYAAVLRLLARWTTQDYLVTAVGAAAESRTLRPAGGEGRGPMSRFCAVAAWVVLGGGVLLGVALGWRERSVLAGFGTWSKTARWAAALLALSEILRLLRLKTTQRYETAPEAGPAAALRRGALHFPTRAGLTWIVCPACGREQRADRALCAHCGLDFVFDGEAEGGSEAEV